MLEGKDDSVVDRSKEMLLSDGAIEELASLKLGNHRSCQQEVGVLARRTARKPSRIPQQHALTPTSLASAPGPCDYSLDLGHP